MANKARIRQLKELIDKLSSGKFSGELVIRFNSGGISSGVKSENIRFEETKT